MIFTMEEYLARTFNNLKTGNFAKLTIVIGNESCDLDSAASSIVYAAYLYWQYQQIKCKTCTKSYRDETFKDDLFVAVLNVNREDFAIKTEIGYCFDKHGVEKSHLVFRNDYDFEELVKKQPTSVILVDHHVLARQDIFLTPFVTEIIDHRPKDKTVWNFNDDTRTTIEIVGSCCTLVAERIKHLCTVLGKDVEFFQTHPICNELLHSTIILDTANLSKEYNKATKKDEEIILFLESFIEPFNYEENRQCKHQQLQGAKSDVSALTAAQLLRKDYKVFGPVFVPVFPILVEEVLQKPHIKQALHDALSTHGCKLALLLGMRINTEEMCRDAALCCSEGSEDTVAELRKMIEECKTPPFQLVPLSVKTDIQPCVYYKQLNLSATRKQYVPVCNAFIEMLKKKK